MKVLLVIGVIAGVVILFLGGMCIISMSIVGRDMESFYE